MVMSILLIMMAVTSTIRMFLLLGERSFTFKDCGHDGNSDGNNNGGGNYSTVKILF